MLSNEAKFTVQFLDEFQLDYALNFHDGAQVVNYGAFETARVFQK